MQVSDYLKATYTEMLDNFENDLSPKKNLASKALILTQIGTLEYFNREFVLAKLALKEALEIYSSLDRIFHLDRINMAEAMISIIEQEEIPEDFVNGRMLYR